MAQDDTREQTNTEEGDPASRAGQTHSGTPNATNPGKTPSKEHKSGYGGEGGQPRTSSDDRDENGS